MYGIIYLITNKKNGKQYVGKTTVSLKRRWIQHKSESGCRALSSAIAKYGQDSFLIYEIDRVDSEKELNEKECLWIDRLSTVAPNGYNLTLGGEGAKHGEETRKLLSQITRGLEVPEERRVRISQTLMGRKMPEEQRLKMVGRKLSPEHRENLSKSLKGHKVSEETGRKISKAKTGAKYPPKTEESKRRSRESLLRYWETASRKPVSEELRKIRRENALRQWEKKRGRNENEKPETSPRAD